MDFIPEVKMDFIPDEEDMEPDPETGEENPNMVYEEKEEIIAEVKSSKDDIDPDEIFAFEKKEPPPPAEPQPRLTKKGKPFKKRPPMTEAHKEKLKAAREKAVAVRRAKAQVRRQDKELDKKKTNLQRLKKKKEVEELESEVGETLPPKTPHNSPPQKSMDDAIMEGIMKYETLRKQRKKEKQDALKAKSEEDALKNKLRQAMTPPKQYNPYSGCY